MVTHFWAFPPDVGIALNSLDIERLFCGLGVLLSVFFSVSARCFSSLSTLICSALNRILELIDQKFQQRL